MTILKKFGPAMLAAVLMFSGAATVAAAADDGGLSKMQSVVPAKPVSGKSFVDGAGGQRSIADFRGKVVLLNFWATWCAPCIKEMPSLDRLQAKMKGEGLEVVTLSQDRGKKIDKAQTFFADNGWTHLDFYLDERSMVARDMGARGLPTSVVIDRQGNEIARLTGTAEWDSPPIIAYLRKVLKEN